MIGHIAARARALLRLPGVGNGLIVAATAVVLSLLAMFLVARFWILTGAGQYVQDWEIANLTAAVPQDPDIIIAAINEDTLTQFAYRSPVDRGFVANLLTQVAAKHPRAIGLDLLLDQPTEPTKDKTLYTALRALPVPLTVSFTGLSNVVSPAQRAYETAFVPAKMRGLATIPTDQLDTVREIYPGGIGVDGHYELSFSHAIAAKVGVKVPNVSIPIAWHGSPARNIPAFKEYPAQIVPLLPAAWFRNKIVLIGSDLTLVDRHRTPFSIAGSHDEGMLPGIVIQANALSQLIHHVSPPQVGWGVNFAVTLLLGLIGALLGLSNYSLIPRIAAAIAIGLLLWIAGAALFHYEGRMIALIAPTLSLAGSFWVLDSFSGREARRQRAYIQGLFSRYLSHQVVEQLVRDPGRVSLEGERRTMTFLFSDIQDFTTMSENIESRALTALLNSYLESMTQLVQKHDGIVDKFIGDAVFAIFNAPLDVPDHAEKAVQCALEMDRFTEDFRTRQREAGVPFGHTRIGVHTGAATVGNFGSLQHMSYTAQGDAVNTASRLEGLNKHLGTRICVSNSTRELCHGIAFRPVASVVLKGKTRPVEVWEPLRDGELSQGFLERYCAAFTKLQTESPDARALFDALRTEAPDDPCVALHLERLHHGDKGTAVVMNEK